MRKKTKIIDGIYNYCDRWCEHCPFSNRCTVGIAESLSTDDEKDISKDAFWKKLSDSFAKTVVLLKKEAKKHGIEIVMPSEEEVTEFAQKEDDLRQKLKETDLLKLCKNYALAIKTWYNKAQTEIENQKTELVQHFEMGLDDENRTIEKLKSINQSIDVLFWYQWFISVKFSRAMHGKIEDDNWEEENGFQKDSDGSAKIALIAAERSLDTLAQLADLMPNMMDDLLPMMANLQKIIRLGDAEFEDARKFVRPGFDE